MKKSENNMRVDTEKVETAYRLSKNEEQSGKSTAQTTLSLVNLSFLIFLSSKQPKQIDTE